MSPKSLVRKLACVLIVTLAASIAAAGCTPAKKTVKVAFIGPLTGPNAMQGVGARNSFNLAIKQANESGKFNFTVEVVNLDDASTPGTAVAVSQKAVMDKDIVAASGFWNSSCAQAAIPVFVSGKMSLVIWAAASEDLTKEENFPYITRVANTTMQENSALSPFVLDKLGLKKWAIVSDTTVYGKDDTEAWKKEVAKRQGAEVVSVDEVQVGTSDFRAILSKIKALKPDGIYFGGVVMEGALLKRQMSELGMDNILMAAISGIPTDKYIEAATPEAAEGTIAIVPGKAIEELPGGRDFVSAYQKEGFAEPYSTYGPNAYDAANMIVAAISQVGPDRAKITDAIAKMNYTGLLGTTSFDNKGQTTNVLATVVVVDDGKWVPYDNSNYASGKKKLPSAK